MMCYFVDNEFKESFHNLIHRYCPWISTIPLNQGMVWDPVWKSTPTQSYYAYAMGDLWRQRGHSEKAVRAFQRVRSCFISLPLELSSFQHLMTFVHAAGEQWSQGVIWAQRTRYAFDKENKVFSGMDLDLFERQIGPLFPSFKDLGIVPVPGKLGQSIVGTKRRIFAIGNYVNQGLLKPIHDWLAQVLSRIPMDGTFDQTRPLDRLKGEKVCYSYDLKSATDRWPLKLMFESVTLLFDRSFASSVVNSCLATNIFQIPFTVLII